MMNQSTDEPEMTEAERQEVNRRMGEWFGIE